MVLTSLKLITPDTIYGALFLGSTLSSIFYGMTLLQTIVYYTTFPKDPWINKYSVALLVTLDTFHLVLAMHATYHYLVLPFGSRVGLPLIPVWSVKLQVLVNVAVVILVQSLYAMRVWKFSGQHRGLLGYAAGGLLLIGLAVGAVLGYELYTINTFLDLDNISWAIIGSFSTAAGIDVIVAVATCICLRQSRGVMSVIPKLNSRIKKLIVYTIISGLATSFFAIAAVIAYVLMPNNFVFIAIEFLLTRLYANSFLALLNARDRSLTNRTGGSSAPNFPRKKKKGDTVDFAMVPDPLGHGLPMIKEAWHHEADRSFMGGCATMYDEHGDDVTAININVAGATMPPLREHSGDEERESRDGGRPSSDNPYQPDYGYTLHLKKNKSISKTKLVDGDADSVCPAYYTTTAPGHEVSPVLPPPHSPTSPGFVMYSGRRGTVDAPSSIHGSMVGLGMAGTTIGTGDEASLYSNTSVRGLVFAPGPYGNLPHHHQHSSSTLPPTPKRPPPAAIELDGHRHPNLTRTI